MVSTLPHVLLPYKIIHKQKISCAIVPLPSNPTTAKLVATAVSGVYLLLVVNINIECFGSTFDGLVRTVVDVCLF